MDESAKVSCYGQKCGDGVTRKLLRPLRNSALNTRTSTAPARNAVTVRLLRTITGVLSKHPYSRNVTLGFLGVPVVTVGGLRARNVLAFRFGRFFLGGHWAAR